MSMSPSSEDSEGTSTKPYLIRALHEWCTDNGFVPYLAVRVGPGVQVPREFVKNQEIVLNLGFDATSGLSLGNEFIEFKARFGGVARDILVPVDQVLAIYARENGQGMAFPMREASQPPGLTAVPAGGSSPEPAVQEDDGAPNVADATAPRSAAGGAGALRLAAVDGEVPSEPVKLTVAPRPLAAISPADDAGDDEPEPPREPPSGASGTPGSTSPNGAAARPGLRRIK